VQSPGLDRGFAVSGPLAKRLYVRPVGFLSGDAAKAACAAGSAAPLAGGPLAFTHVELLARNDGHVAVTAASLHDLKGWARACGGEVERHVAGVLARISTPRPAFAGSTLDRPRIMGILNATPDSFSDGGMHLAPEAAIARGRALISAGADIVDIGGESTRPGAVPVPPDEELRRVRPVLIGLSNSNTALSIDTRHSAVIEAAIDAGAAIVNDVTALAGDPRSLALAADRRAFVVLMHMRGDPVTMNEAPSYRYAPLDVYDFLEDRVEACVAAGLPRAHIVVDPGLGFGKTTEHNVAILERISLLHGLGCGILLGASRKLALGAARNTTEPMQRLGASLGAALGALEQGVQLLRVHDVTETRQAVDIWHALRNGL
jgi:dihydropteroate synthase